MSTRGPLDHADALWVVHHDYSGLGRAKSVPPDRFEAVQRDGVTFGLAAWDYLFNGEQVPDAAFGLETGDFRVVPDAATLVRLPHVAGVAQTLGDIYVDDMPWEGDPRARLREAVANLAELGYVVAVAIEVEFLVLEEADDGSLRPLESEPMYSTSALEGQWDAWLGPVLAALGVTGIEVHQLAREGSPGQYELSLMPNDPLRACDHYLLARQIIKASLPARSVATFMPKPFTELAGNGLHVHMSLTDDAGAEAIPDASDRAALSSVGGSIVAGLLEHARAQCALGAAIPNSYERLIPGSAAPAHAAWDFGNRSVLVRIPGVGPARRIEYRGGDASANVYLHLLGLISTVIASVRATTSSVASASLDLGTVDDAEAARLGAARLPRSLGEALDALGDDPILQAALGPTVSQHYTAMKRLEQALRDKASASEDALAWDRMSYLRVL